MIKVKAVSLPTEAEYQVTELLGEALQGYIICSLIDAENGRALLSNVNLDTISDSALHTLLDLCWTEDCPLDDPEVFEEGGPFHGLKLVDADRCLVRAEGVLIQVEC